MPVRADTFLTSWFGRTDQNLYFHVYAIVVSHLVSVLESNEVCVFLMYVFAHFFNFTGTCNSKMKICPLFCWNFQLWCSIHASRWKIVDM